MVKTNRFVNVESVGRFPSRTVSGGFCVPVVTSDESRASRPKGRAWDFEFAINLPPEDPVLLKVWQLILQCIATDRTSWWSEL